MIYAIQIVAICYLMISFFQGLKAVFSLLLRTILYFGGSFVAQVIALVFGLPYLMWRTFFPKRKTRYDGMRISKVFRKVFESRKVRNSVGVHLVVLFLAGFVWQVPLKAFGDGIIFSGAGSLPDVNVEQHLVLKTDGTFRNPVPGYVSQYFNWYHPGVDIAGNDNRIIYPIASGRVVLIERSRFGYGNNIVVSHGSGLFSRYAHMSVIKTELNQRVTHETPLGYVGTTGWSTGHHLHLEVYQDGVAVNPLAYLPEDYGYMYTNLAVAPNEEILSTLASEEAALIAAGLSQENVASESGFYVASVSAQVLNRETAVDYADLNAYNYLLNASESGEVVATIEGGFDGTAQAGAEVQIQTETGADVTE